MGYTHYWHRTMLSGQTEWDALVGFTRRAISIAAVEIYGWNGYGEPDLTKDLIRFNGKGPEMDHETFVLSRDPRDDVPDYNKARPDSDENKWFSFCKTARKPYDVVVVAVLVEAERLGFLNMSSDGGVDDLAAGIKLNAAAQLATTAPQ